MRMECLKQLFNIEGKVAVITDSGGLASKDVGPVLSDVCLTEFISNRICFYALMAP